MDIPLSIGARLRMFVLPVFADVEDKRTDASSALSVLTFVSLVLFVLMAAVM